MTGVLFISESPIGAEPITAEPRRESDEGVATTSRDRGSRGRSPHRESVVPIRRLAVLALGVVLAFSVFPSFAQSTNAAVVSPPLPSAVPDVMGSLGRVMLALAVVLGVFFAGVWLVRNWQRLVLHKGRAPRLNVLEVRSLGGRQALYVVGYDQERFLIASSPAGVNFLSHLQSADPANEEAPGEKSQPRPSFAQALTQVLKGK